MGRPGSGRFVGREEELRICAQVLDEVEIGEPTTVLVLGEAGLGKSRLSTAVADQVRDRGGLVLTSHGLDLDGGELPYGLVSELLRDLDRQVGVKQVRALLKDGLSALDPLASGSTAATNSRQVDRVLVLAAVVTLLQRLADQQTVCWWVEDLQWADQPSRDIVRYVSRVAEGSRLLLLATVRTDPDGTPARELDELVRDPDVEVLRLSPLDASEVQELVADLTQGRELSVDQAGHISELSDGIPFFVEELAAHEGRGLPSSLNGLMQHRLDHLPETAQDLLASVATSGTLVPFADLGAVLDASDDEIGAALDECVSRGLLDIADGDLIGFRHALLAEAVLASLLPQVRRSWHRRWALWLDEVATRRPGTDVLFARARHWYASGDAAAALRPSVDAARAAHAADASSEEAHHWSRVHQLWLEAGGELGDLDVAHRDVVVPWFFASAHAHGWEDASTVLDALISSPDLQDDWLVGVFATTMTARLQSRSGQPALLDDDELDTLLERLGAMPASPLVAETFHHLVHEHEIARPDICEWAWTLLESLTPADADALTIVENHHHQASLAARHGDFDAALLSLRAAYDSTAGATRTARTFAAHALLENLWMAGRSQEALDLVEPLLADVIAGDAGGRNRTALLGMYALVLTDVGRWSEAEQHAERILREREEDLRRAGAEDSWLEADARVTLTRIALRQRREADAHEAAALAETDSDDFDLVWTWAHPLIEVAAYADDRTAIRRLGARFWDLVAPELSAPLGLYTLLTAARGLLEPRSGEVEPGDTVLVQQRAAQFAYQGALADVTAAELAALVAQAAGMATAATWRHVVEGWVAVGQPYDEALNRIRLAGAAASEGDHREAVQQLRAAQQIADALPSDLLTERLLAVARLHGLKVRSAPTTSANGTGPLTAREHEVLALITEGLSNQEIADRLFMSPKTASVHVSRIITKLGVRNRTEAATLAQRSGLLPASAGRSEENALE
jgi:DNA-binding NarL/FixJ family response regulator